MELVYSESRSTFDDNNKKYHDNNVGGNMALMIALMVAPINQRQQ